MTDQDLQWSRMFRSDATVILYGKTWLWRAYDGTKPTRYAGSLLVTMLLNEHLSLVLCVYTELFHRGVAFQKCCASATPLPQLCLHPSCCTGMHLTGVRTDTQGRPPPIASLRPSALMISVGYSSSERWSGTQSLLVSAFWCPSSNGYLTHRHFGHW